MPTSLHDDTALALNSSKVAVNERLAASQILQGLAMDSLDTTGFLDQATLQGGTAISGCYKGLRLSQDLDFALWQKLDDETKQKITAGLNDTFQSRYGGAVKIHPPKADSDNPVSRWNITVPLVPGRPDIKSVKLKIEGMPITTHQPCSKFFKLPVSLPGTRATAIYVEGEDELIADKIVSFAESSHPRWRDIWDISYLMSATDTNQSHINALVDAKLSDYHIDSQDFLKHAKVAQDMLASPSASEELAAAISGQIKTGKTPSNRALLAAVKATHECLAQAEAHIHELRHMQAANDEPLVSPYLSEKLHDAARSAAAPSQKEEDEQFS